MKFMREAFVRVWRDTRFPRRHPSRTRDKLRLLQHEQLEQRCVLTLPATQNFAEGDLVVYNGPTVDLVNDTPAFDAFVDFGGDVDSYFFVPQFTGTYTIDVGDFGNTVDPEVAVYIASTGAQIGYNDDLSAFNDDARLVINLTADVRYIVVVGDQPATTAGNVSIVVTAPFRTGSFLLALDPLGDASSTVLLDVPTDIDYYSVTAPADANGVLTVSATAPTFNQRLALFDSAGTLLQGPLTSLSISNAVPGQEYRIAVYSNNYATSGSMDLQVNFATERPDILMKSATGNGGTGIAVSYEIKNGNVAPFDIDIFQSNDALMDNADTKIGTFAPGPADRTVGVHTVSLTLGSGISLPGAGIADLNTDYRLLFTADSANLVAEPDVDPLNENNTVAFAGVYHQPAGPVMGFGTDSADTVTVTPNGLNVELKFGNLNTATYPTSDVTQFRLRGAGSDDSFTSGAASATMNIPLAIWGGAGLDTIQGGDGNDTLVGGADNDIYVLLQSELVESDTIEEAPGGGRDMLDFSQLSNAVTLNLGSTAAQTVNQGRLLTLTSLSDIEDATGGSAADSLIGNASANQLFGFGAGDTLNGGAGSDILLGGQGDDIYVFGTASSSEADQVTENTNEGLDTINFAALATSVSLHLGSNATQNVHTNRTLKLNSPNTFENSVGGSGADTLAGNGASNTLTGGAGDDTLNGGAGGDFLFGGLNDDTYVFTTASIAEADQVTENTNEGDDTIDFAALTTSVSLHLGSNATQNVHTNRTLKLNSPNTFENSVGGSGADSLAGNGGVNTLTGGPGDDTLNGGVGGDLLFGGLNNDTYLFTTASASEADQVTENTNEGIDTIDFAALTTSVSLHLGTNAIQNVHTNRTLKLNSPNTFENSIGGSGADSLAGNGADNTLTGGAGDDTLNGGAGGDLLFGGLNNDTYVFTTATVAEADQVSENTNEGTDTISFAALTTSVSLHLGSNAIQNVHTNRTLKLNSPNTFEKSIGGSGADSLAGNGAVNTLTGGPGDDTLNGGAGGDLLFGGLNNDTYVFTTASAAEADQVTENTNEGTDTLNFSTLTTSVVLNLGVVGVQAVHTNRTVQLNSISTFENAVGGSGSDTLIGNTQANRLTGGNGDNILVGLEGTDILESGSGRDILIGGLGLDTLNGGSNDDILIAGRTASDTSASNLNTLRTEWISVNAYALRVANLRAGVGSPAVSLKATINVLNDAGEDDSLTGGTGTDWYFRAVDDVITDLVAGELIDVL